MKPGLYMTASDSLWIVDSYGNATTRGTKTLRFRKPKTIYFAENLPEVLEGFYVRTMYFDDQLIHMFRTKTETVGVIGTYRLDDILEGAHIGRMTQVRYKGTDDSGKPTFAVAQDADFQLSCGIYFTRVEYITDTNSVYIGKY